MVGKLLAVLAKSCVLWPVGQAVKTRPFHGCNMGSIPVRVTKSTCFLVRQVLFLLFRLFVRLCTGIEQPVRPRRSRRSRPGGTVLRTVPQGAGDFPYGSGKGRHPREIIPTQVKKRKPEDGMPTSFNYFGKNVRRELQISAELLFLY